MASPQPKFFTRFSNELLEATIRNPFSGAQFRVLLWIIRNSYGRQRKWAPHPGNRPLADEIKMKASTLQSALETLQEAGVLSKNAAGHWELQKDYDLWHLEGVRTIVQPVRTIVQSERTIVQPVRTIVQNVRTIVQSPNARAKKEEKIKKEEKLPSVAEQRKSDAFRVFMDGIISDYTEYKVGDPDPKEKAAVSAYYARFGRAAKQILAFAKGDPVVARRGLEAIGARFNKKEFNGWGLDAVAKNFPQWIMNPEAYGKETRTFR